MAFKRALWHSGLTYQQTCYHCRAVVRYNDYQLDFRPWYPDGFVYCPRCRGPLRHNELYAINPDGSPYYQQPVAQPAPKPAANLSPCPNCGKPVALGVDHFCSGCGQKLEWHSPEIQLLISPFEKSLGLCLFSPAVSAILNESKKTLCFIISP